MSLPTPSRGLDSKCPCRAVGDCFRGTAAARFLDRQIEAVKLPSAERNPETHVERGPALNSQPPPNSRGGGVVP